MNNFLIYDIKETFCRYFVVAIHNKMNLTAFTDYLASSNYVRNIENGNLIEISDISVEEGYQLLLKEYGNYEYNNRPILLSPK